MKCKAAKGGRRCKTHFNMPLYPNGKCQYSNSEIKPQYNRIYMPMDKKSGQTDILSSVEHIDAIGELDIHKSEVIAIFEFVGIHEQRESVPHTNK